MYFMSSKRSREEEENMELILFIRSKQIQRTLLKSIALNGIIYLGILGILELFYPDHQLFGHSYTVIERISFMRKRL